MRSRFTHERNAEPDHWTERGRATSVANSDVTVRPRRSVPSLGDVTRMMFLKRILIYLGLLPVSFVAFAVAWALLAPSCLYHCWDDAPPFLVSWCPPFIHPWADSLDGKLHNFYHVPEWLVYSVWLLFIAGVFLVPAFVVWRFVMRRKTSPNHALLTAAGRRGCNRRASWPLSLGR